MSITYSFQGKERLYEAQLIQLIEDLVRQIVTGEQVGLILLDFSKAFDKVSNPKLLFKLTPWRKRKYSKLD